MEAVQHTSPRVDTMAAALGVPEGICMRKETHTETTTETRVPGVLGEEILRVGTTDTTGWQQGEEEVMTDEVPLLKDEVRYAKKFILNPQKMYRKLFV